jgi:hypothetical protein
MPLMSQLGRIIVIVGVILVVTGLALWGLGRLGFRGLPGDIHYDSGHTRVHIPLVTCLVASIVLTILISAVLWLWHWLAR